LLYEWHNASILCYENLNGTLHSLMQVAMEKEVVMVGPMTAMRTKRIMDMEVKSMEVSYILLYAMSTLLLFKNKYFVFCQLKIYFVHS